MLRWLAEQKESYNPYQKGQQGGFSKSAHCKHNKRLLKMFEKYLALPPYRST